VLPAYFRYLHIIEFLSNWKQLFIAAMGFVDASFCMPDVCVALYDAIAGRTGSVHALADMTGRTY